MRSIESTDPVRVRDTGQSSARDAALIRALRKDVQELKRELVLRDAMTCAGVAGSLWLGEATEGQKQRTSAVVGRYLSSSPSVGGTPVPFEEDGVPCPSPLVSSLVGEIQTAAQVSWLASCMRDILWDACESDAAKVEALVRKYCKDGMNAASPLTEEVSTDVATDELSAAAVVGESVDGEVEAEGSKSEGGIGKEAATDCGNPEGEACSAGEQEVVVDRFSAFKSGAGAELHEAYELSKKSLKAAKLRQKELVMQVNQLKLAIDTLTEKAVDGEDGSGGDASTHTKSGKRSSKSLV